MSRILIVDDEASICWTFREFFSELGHRVDVAATAEEGLEMAAHGVDALLLDVRLPGMDGLTALEHFRARLGAAPIVMMTAFGDLETAVRAIEGGAFDYLVKPFDLDQAGAVIERALDQRSAAIGRARPAAAVPAEPEALIGSSPAMQELFKSIALAAAADVPVLITGESGTGKELVARAIHRHSHRRHGPFLPVCLAALNPGLVERELFGHVRGSFTGAVQDRKGLLELAQGGTVLLDEVGDIPAAQQVKLLRAIERREVTPVGDARPRPIDIRVLAATNRPLDELMATGQFRDDLFYRLNVFSITLPPLRDRRQDIPALAEHFLRQSHHARARQSRLSPATLAALCTRDWAGNIRELRNAIEHAAIVARGGTIDPEHLPQSRPPTFPDGSRELQEHATRWARQEAGRPAKPDVADGLYERYLAVVEPPLLRAVLDQCQGNKAAAAERLGIHRATLRQRLRRYGLA